MRYSIVFSTRTGNTQRLAETVHDTLDKKDCIYFGFPDSHALEADRLYVGFWTDKGVCDEATADFLKTVKNKEVFLFGTAGFGGSQAYFDGILKKTEALLDSTVRVVGTYMCQGKMPMSVRKRYEAMAQSPNPMPNLKAMIDNFDSALSHPDQTDFLKLGQRVQHV